MILSKLTVLWEGHTEEGYERKRGKYQDLIDTCKERGYQSYCYPVEVGCSGFIAHITMKFMKDMGIVGKQRQTVCKMLQEAVEMGSSWIMVIQEEITLLLEVVVLARGV